MKIAIVSPLRSFTAIYSVAGVMLAQARSLARAGHDVTIMVNHSCTELPEDNEGYQINSCFESVRYGINLSQEDYEYANESILRTLRGLLPSFDFCITHDVTFLYDFLPFNLAVRLYSIENSNIRWLHWLHSSPKGLLELLQVLPADVRMRIEDLHKYKLLNSRIVSLNKCDITAIAEYYRVDENSIVQVPNGIDFVDFLGIHNESIPILNAADIFAKDIVIFYPARTTVAKQFEKLILLATYLKAKNESFVVILAPSFSNSDEGMILRSFLSMIKRNSNLLDHELVITTELGFEMGVPAPVVRDLFLLSNFFVFPSLGEAAPLILLEAAATGNVLILNNGVEAMHEFGKDTYYINFDGAPIQWLELDLPRFSIQVIYPTERYLMID